ncbi:MAG: RDD family protein [Brevinematales bacterium]|nr:RDD family protein [Brevinematales bacterium]
MSERKPLSPPFTEEDAPQSIPMAPTWKRIIAFFIDYFFLSLLFSLVFSLSVRSALLEYIRNIPEGAALPVQELQKLLFSLYQQHFWAYSLFDLVLWGSYFILFWKASGQTIGAKVMNIRVFPGIPPTRPQKNPWDLSWGMCFSRFFFFYLAIQVYGIPFLFVFDKELNIRFHDFFSRSVVISLTPKKQNKTNNE